MKIGEKIEKIKRYKDISILLIKYGRSDLVQQAGLSDFAPSDGEVTSEESEKADEFATDLENLGATFIKLGQLLSTRADLFPQQYL
ncbi:MAG: AarF/ABC1/UbiB kinase family protein, partial [Pyrinomonadaceae bacterium]|nr:AarF/ABC1/UbiB kinase family protein [Pyrinomonadaceae bacterium]